MKNFKILSEQYTKGYCSVTIMHQYDGKNVRFKVWYENGNCYYRGAIEVEIENCSYKPVYYAKDIPGCTFEPTSWYGDKEERRIAAGKRCINLMLDFIKKVY